MVEQLAPKALSNGQSLPTLAIGSWHVYDKLYIEDAVDLVRTGIELGVSHFDVGSYDIRYPLEAFRLLLQPMKEGEDAVAMPRERAMRDAARSKPLYTDVIFGALMRMSGLPRDSYTVQMKLWLIDYEELDFHAQLDRLCARTDHDYAELAIIGGYLYQTDLEAVVHEIADLVREGRIGGWGVNNWRIADMEQAIRIADRDGLPRPVIAQNKYSVARRTVAMSPRWVELYEHGGVALQPSDLLEGGLLSGKLSGTRDITPDNGEVFGRIGSEVVPRVVSLAVELGASPAQVALAYVLAFPGSAAAVMGMSSVPQVRDNVGAVALAAEHGAMIRESLDDLWIDRDVVDPQGVS